MPKSFSTECTHSTVHRFCCDHLNAKKCTNAAANLTCFKALTLNLSSASLVKAAVCALFHNGCNNFVGGPAQEKLNVAFWSVTNLIKLFQGRAATLLWHLTNKTPHKNSRDYFCSSDWLNFRVELPLSSEKVLLDWLHKSKDTALLWSKCLLQPKKDFAVGRIRTYAPRGKLISSQSP